MVARLRATTRGVKAPPTPGALPAPGENAETMTPRNSSEMGEFLQAIGGSCSCSTHMVAEEVHAASKFRSLSRRSSREEHDELRETDEVHEATGTKERAGRITERPAIMARARAKAARGKLVKCSHAIRLAKRATESIGSGTETSGEQLEVRV